MRPQLLSALNTSRSRFLGKTGTSGRMLGIGRLASGTGFDMKPYWISASIIALSPFWYGKRARVLWQAACGWFGIGCAFEFRNAISCAPYLHSWQLYLCFSSPRCENIQLNTQFFVNDCFYTVVDDRVGQNRKLVRSVNGVTEQTVRIGCFLIPTQKGSGRFDIVRQRFLECLGFRCGWLWLVGCWQSIR